MDLQTLKFLPWLPLVGAVLCLACCAKPALRKAAGPISVISIFLAFLLAVGAYPNVQEHGVIVEAFRWIGVGGLEVSFGYYIDTLTMLMLFVVCGIGSLVALYATGYMAGERGYARFFAAVSLFIFAMTTLVMADNLVLLYLGWEGVGLCSYLLIGYYYEKPSAVAAAKKAFIVNRVGDMGFALGIFLTYWAYGTLSIPEILEHAHQGGSGLGWADTWIPFLLMLGAFGKSAQIPLYVWLPDAMEGPTPVSALIHAATMVTAGVYMIARLVALYQLSPYALPTVAIIGGLTAIFAATIALCQYDIKRIWAYSTVSQLGYMFLGVGVLSTVSGMFHLFTHAFFKALLFLTAGSVMHAMAGQLDLRKMSGLRHKMPVTCWLMFVGALALAGFPGTAGFFSKDMILAYTMEKGLAGHASLYLVLGAIGLITAFLTAYYTFRLWFRVFWGPQQYEMGQEHHGVEEHAAGHPHNAEEEAAMEQAQAHGHAHEPHEMPLWPMNLPLVVLAIGSLVAGYLAFGGEHYGWVGSMIDHSTAAVHHAAAHGEAAAAAAAQEEISRLGLAGLHTEMQIISGVLAVLGIALAWYFHLADRGAADRAAAAMRPIVTVLENKYYVDELYDAVIVKPLRFLGYTFFVMDQLLINGLVLAVGYVPRLLGLGVRPAQSGRLQGYGLGMAFGLGVVALLALMAIAAQ
ncbi:MAG TPA: NADH-quinone oxidoreductase subunit L [Phycisphaeraceae bacterium]